MSVASSSAGVGLESVSRDADLLVEALRSGGGSDGRRELPGSTVLPGNVHPDHTGDKTHILFIPASLTPSAAA